MDVDSASSSPSSRLSVVCSASAEYSSNSSEGSSPNSRRNSMNESVIKDEHYWERRRRNNDASRRSREKRRMNDLAMEEKILLLKAENERLKSQLLENRDKPPPPLPLPLPPALPQQLEPPSNIIIPDVSISNNLLPLSVAANPVASMLSVPLLQASAPHFPMLQLCQLQPPIQSPIYPTAHQSTSASTASTSTSASASAPRPFFSSTSAFHPFRPSESTSSSENSYTPTLAASSSSVIMKVERRSPDSSTDNDNVPIREFQIEAQLGSNVIQRVGTPSFQQQQQQQQQQGVVVQNQQQGPSLLSALLSQRRPSPTVPQSRTEHISGLTSPPRVRHGSSKSDCESVSSSASLSPSHSSEDHSNYSNKSPQYVDRRRRNNEAAKRCRANRRAVFEYRSRRVQLLEGENEDLCRQISTLKAEIAHCKSVLAQRASVPQL